jgi:hypothetical protein
LLVIACRNDRRWSKVWLLAFATEFFLGIAGFFAGFRTVFIVTILALFASQRLAFRQYLYIFAMAILCIWVGIAWTAVKTDFRDYLNEGTGQQIVTKPYLERAATLGAMVVDIDKYSYAKAAQVMVGRIGYVEIFGYVLDNVPSFMPHADGELWSAALSHVLAPRLFFPEKPGLVSDSELTNQYTGMQFASDAEGTSVSMGYAVEAYIDFGWPYMYIPLVLIGLFWGALYRLLSLSSTRGGVLISSAFSLPPFLALLSFEASFVKLFGGILTVFLVCFATRLAIGSRLHAYLTRQQTVGAREAL